MITTREAAMTILEADPGVDPDVFWPSVGITREVADYIGHKHAAEYGITYAVAMATLESGATLARHPQAMEVVA